MTTEKHPNWVQRKLVRPVIGALRSGATPRRLAWSLAIGIVIGINPVLGSTTLLALAAAWLLRLNVAVSQVGTHGVYPLQLILLLPFLHAGTVLFHTDPLPLTGGELMHLARLHPLGLVQQLWVWVWHGLVVWACLAVIITPCLAVIFRRVLQRAMKTHASRRAAPSAGLS